jgi:hypothetical protein
MDKSELNKGWPGFVNNETGALECIFFALEVVKYYVLSE